MKTIYYVFVDADNCHKFKVASIARARYEELIENRSQAVLVQECGELYIVESPFGVVEFKSFDAVSKYLAELF